MHYNYFRTYDPSSGRYTRSDPTGLEASLNTYSYVDANPLTWIDVNGLIKLPGDPSGLPPEWTPDPSHQDPSGDRYRHPNGDYVDFHKGRKGERGWKGKDHWHHNGDKKHLNPGDEAPDSDDSSSCGDGCETTAKTVITVGGVYIIYRCVRMLPSLAPPLWWTLPANAATP